MNHIRNSLIDSQIVAHVVVLLVTIEFSHIESERQQFPELLGCVIVGKRGRENLIAHDDAHLVGLGKFKIKRVEPFDSHLGDIVTVLIVNVEGGTDKGTVWQRVVRIGNHAIGTTAPAGHGQGNLFVIEFICMVVQEGEHRVGHLSVPQRGADDNGVPGVKTLYARFDFGPVSGIDLAALIVGVVVCGLAFRTWIVAMVLDLEQRATTIIDNFLGKFLGHATIGVIHNQRAYLGGCSSLTSSTHRHQ